MSDIDVTDLTPAQVLTALYNASHPLGLGILNPTSGTDLTVYQAQHVLDQTHAKNGRLQAPDRPVYVDYLQGRVIKTRIGGDTVDPRMYDRDNGTGAAARAIAALRSNPA